jgi:4-amino-4-deoxychorismate lyase
VKPMHSYVEVFCSKVLQPCLDFIHLVTSHHAGILKYWLSSGRGSFGLSRMECIESSFYCVATTENKRPFDRTMGWAACTSPIAPKPAPFGEIKSTNYLQNVLVKVHAEAEELDVVSAS